MNSGKECAVCQTLRIVLDICPTFHSLDYFMLNIVHVLMSLCELGNSRNLINSVTWKGDDVIFNVYVSRLTRCTNSYNESLLIIKRSTCFGLLCPKHVEHWVFSNLFLYKCNRMNTA